MKPIIKIAFIGNGWVCRFTIGVQTFTLDFSGERSKKDALWQKKMLQNAFNNLK